MELPIDHFRLLGVSPAIDAQSVLRTLQQRLDRPPEDGFTAESLEARAQLLRESADLLADGSRRERYETELTAVPQGDPGAIPALVIPSSREVGGLILLWEAGLGAQALELASRSLQPPQAPALGSGRESDLALVAGLASRQAAQDCQQERQYERAAEMLLKGQQLLQRMGQHHGLRQELAKERDGLLPYRVLQLLSRQAVPDRQEGLALLDRLVERRHGLDGDADPDFARPAFEAFLTQIRLYLTVQEQIDLFGRWAQEGSRRADILTAMALAASGFAQRKPQRISEAAERLRRIDATGLSKPVACLTLLLGQVEEAQALFARSTGPADASPSDTGTTDGAEAGSGPSPLAELCLTCAGWLRDEVLPGYRDVEIEADLQAWFDDRDVQAYVVQQDRRLGRSRPATVPGGVSGGFSGGASSEASAAVGSTPPFLKVSGSPGAPDSPSADLGSAPWPPIGGAFSPGTGPGASGEPADGLQGDHEPEDEEAWEEDPFWSRWSWPSLPAINLPSFAALAEDHWLRRGGLRRHPATWLALGGGIALAAAIGWSLRPKPQVLPVQPAPTADRPLSAPATRPPALNADPAAPLRTPTPSDDQIRQLLSRWLAAKALVMAGKQADEPLAQLASAPQLDRLSTARSNDQKAGLHMTIDARIIDLRVVRLGPDALEARAQILYRDQVLDRNNRVLSQEPPGTLRNTYVVSRGADGIWRLTDFRPGF